MHLLSLVANSSLRIFYRWWAWKEDPLYTEGLGSCLVKVPDLIMDIRIEFDGLHTKVLL